RLHVVLARPPAGQACARLRGTGAPPRPRICGRTVTGVGAQLGCHLACHARTRRRCLARDTLLTFNPAFTLLVAALALGGWTDPRQTCGVAVILLGAYLLEVAEGGSACWRRCVRCWWACSPPRILERQAAITLRQQDYAHAGLFITVHITY